MKTIKVLMLMFIMITALTVTEKTSSQEFELIMADTVSNSMTEEGVLNLTRYEGKTIDSVIYVLICQGEIDLDLMLTYRGFNANTSGIPDQFYTLAAIDSTVLTVNLDSANYSITRVKAQTNFTGINKIKTVLVAASSGNNATDPGRYELWALVYIRKI